MSASLERLLPFIVDRIEVGIFALDKGCNVVLWNSFMATHSGHAADEVGRKRAHGDWRKQRIEHEPQPPAQNRAGRRPQAYGNDGFQHIRALLQKK